MKNGLVLFLLMAIGSSFSAAQATAEVQNSSASSKTKISNAWQEADSQYPSFSRIMVLGGITSSDTSSHAIGFNGEILADFGRGWFSIESGVEFLNMQPNVKLTDVNGATLLSANESLNYVGVPLVAKLNYIEQKNSSFSFKAGAMPVMLISNSDPLTDSSGNATNIVIKQNEIFALAGITGTAAISSGSAFVMDLTYLYGTSNYASNGTQAQTLLFNLGLRFNL